MGTQLSFPQRVIAPKFSADVYCGQTAGWIKTVLDTEVGLSPGDFVLDGDPATLSKKGTEPPPQLSAHVYCGQTAGWIKMALGMKVGLSPGEFVLHEDPAPPQKGLKIAEGALSLGQNPLPNFRPISIVAKWLDASRCHLVRR